MWFFGEKKYSRKSFFVESIEDKGALVVSLTLLEFSYRSIDTPHTLKIKIFEGPTLPMMSIGSVS
jgi:hypothetical protein